MKVRRIDFSPDEWLAGTLALEDVERGIYITACALIYSHGGPVPKEELRRLCRSHGNAYRRAIARLLELGKLVENDGHFVVNRCAIEIEKARKRLSNLRQFPPYENEINELQEPFGDSDSRGRGTINHQPSTIKEEARPPGTVANDGLANGFSGKVIQLASDGIAECRKVYPFDDLESRLVIYDAKWADRAELGPLHRVLAFLAQDAPRRRGVLSSAVDPPANKQESDRKAHLLVYEKTGRWFKHWGPHPANGAAA